MGHIPLWHTITYRIILSLYSAKMKKTLYSPEKRELCKKLVEAREKANLKQSDVERLTGILQSELSKIENGQRKIEFLTVVVLAQLYKVDVSFFIPHVENQSNEG